MNTKEQKKKEDYQSPTMDVVLLQNTGVLMTSELPQASMDGVFVEEII